MARLIGRLLFCLLMAGLVGTSSSAEEQISPLPVREIAPGLFVHQGPYALAAPRNEGAIANAGFIVGRDAVAVIDTEGSYRAGRGLLAAVRARTALPIRYVINTHVHPDHLLGNAAFSDENPVFVGHANLPAALAARADSYLTATKNLIGESAFAGTRILAPTLLVKDRLVLDLGERPLILESWPTAHTNTDLTVYDEKTATWFLGDLLFAGHVPALDGNLGGWLKLVEVLKARKAERVVPGHGPSSMPWPAALAPMEHYLQTLRSDIRGMVRKGDTIQDAARQAGRTEATKWSLFDDFNPRNATTAFHELEWE